MGYLWDTILYIGYLIKPTWDTSECCGDVKGIWNFMGYSTYGIFSNGISVGRDCHRAHSALCQHSAPSNWKMKTKNRP